MSRKVAKAGTSSDFSHSSCRSLPLSFFVCSYVFIYFSRLSVLRLCLSLFLSPLHARCRSLLLLLLTVLPPKGGGWGTAPHRSCASLHQAGPRLLTMCNMRRHKRYDELRSPDDNYRLARLLICMLHMNIIATDLMCEELTAATAHLTATLYASGASLHDSSREDPVSKPSNSHN